MAVQLFIEAGIQLIITLASLLEKNVLSPFLDPIQQSIGLPSVLKPAVDYLYAHQSVHSKDFPLMNFFHVLAISAWYLVMVFGGKSLIKALGLPKYQLKGFSQIHNAFLVWLSAYMCLNILYQAVFVRGYQLFNNDDDKHPEAFPLAQHVWLFYFSKIFEFVDTFIMVLKQNNRQISFLHVYHHCSIFMIWWLTTFMAPTSEAYFSSFLNSLIHVVMYSYYLCSSLGVLKSVMSKVKPFITIGQMTQFSLMMCQATWNIFSYYFLLTTEQRERKYPIGLTYLLWFYMWTMLGLFANFFVQNYKKPQKKRVEKPVEKEE